MIGLHNLDHFLCDIQSEADEIAEQWESGITDCNN